MHRDRILVVDDDRDVLESLQDELYPWFDVDAVSSGTEAIKKLQRSGYDAVIADLRMPDVSGIVVLDWVKRLQPNTVRIMLTGHLDEEARQATRGHDAPFKIAKPWHDALDVTLRRAFENRERIRNLDQSFSNLLSTADVDDELAAAEGLGGISTVLVSRAGGIDGVLGFSVTMVVGTEHQILADLGGTTKTFQSPGQWRLQLPLTADGRIQITALGVGEKAHDIITVLIGRAQKWASNLSSPAGVNLAFADPVSRAQIFALNRRATLGAMAASILHELATLAQNIDFCVGDLETLVRDHARNDVDLITSLDRAMADSRRIVGLFRSLRTFLRSGEAQYRRYSVKEIVNEAVSLCAPYGRKRNPIVVVCEGDPAIDADRTALVQVVVNLLRNAVEAVDNGDIEVLIRAENGRVVIAVSDNGPGVPQGILDHLFEPFVTSKPTGSGCGLGLAVASRIITEHRGDIRHEQSNGRGARFIVNLPASANF